MRLRHLTVVAAIAVCAAPAPATAAPARIAFSAAPGPFGFGSDVYTMNADGSDRRRLTHGGDVAGPAWSPDAASLAFARYDDLGDDVAQSRIFVMRADGAGQRPLTKGKRDSFAVDPDWSPDGGRIVYAQNRLASDSILISLVVMNADGSAKRTIFVKRARSLDGVYAPAWSPDGERILFTRVRLDDEFHFRPSLYSVRPDGTDLRLIARDGASGAWSPDGGRIAFVSIRDRNGERCGSDECGYATELYVMNADGSSPLRLTNGAGDEGSPEWSPDGARIAFDSDRNFPVDHIGGGPSEVYSLRPDGSCMTWLTNGTALSGEPSWEPGTSLSSDPGGCGTAREPLLETGLGPAQAFHAFPIYWAGRTTPDNLLVSYTDREEGGLDIGYGDCAAFDPAACGPEFDIRNRSSCAVDPLRDPGFAARNLSAYRGAILYREEIDDEVRLELYTGRTTVLTYAQSDAHADGILSALRAFGADAPPTSLARARFSSRVWRKLDQVAAARQRLGSVAAVSRSLHTSRREVRRRLALRKRLRQLGARRLHCSR